MNVCGIEERNRPIDTDSYYESQAEQEEIYLEEGEEELRMILECDEPATTPAQNSASQQEDAVVELITGNSDDPPLSKEEVADLLRI